MLLSSSYNPSQPPRLSPQYTHQQQNNMLAFPPSQDGMWNDLDLQPSSKPAPSLSRRASTQRPTAASTLQRGNSMRIVKPSLSGSTHNSPLGLGLSNKAALGRRMTVMGDSSGYRRRRLLEATAAIGQQQQQVIQQQSQGQNQMRQRAGTTMQARPMSWCPTMSTDANQGMESWGGNTTQQQGEAILRRQAAQYSPESQLRLQQLQQWQQMQLQNQEAAQQQAQQQQAARMRQAQAQLQMQQQAAQEANYFALAAQPSSNNQTPYFSQQNTPLQFPSYALPMNNYYDNSYASTPLDMPMANQSTFPAQQDYNMYNTNLIVPNSFMAASTTPPTPETFPMQDQFQPQYIAAQDFSLDNQEDEGEVLVGLGLYSAPEKTPVKPVVDSHLAELYARAGMPVLEEKNKAGKGLKLEETWEPPKEEESDGDDAEGEEEEEELDEVDELNAGKMMPPPQVPQQSMVGWL